MKTILLFGAGKSATVLIDYLIVLAEKNKWKCIIADSNKDQILSKTNHSPFVEAVQADINNEEQRGRLIERSHVVISMMPPSLHFLIAKDCVEYRKHLLTASYLDGKMKSLEDEIGSRKLLFLCEMGLDPGIDHMSAMKIIDSIKEKGGVITSFKSHCGGLVAPESDDNPWRYKISWNPRNVVLAGNSGAVYKVNNDVKKIDYKDLFNTANKVMVKGLDDALAYYPNRDSLGYIPIYKLTEAATFMRTTLRYPVYFEGWNAMVHAGLTDDLEKIKTAGLTYAQWARPVMPFVNKQNEKLLEYLGLFDTNMVPTAANTSADILQYLLETKLPMHPLDKDMIVMLHEFEYVLNNCNHTINSSLVVKGQDGLRTAMAKTVGLPLGIAAKLILEDKIKLKGLHIPIKKEIYEPVLKELEMQGIAFTESE
ncbi:MAG: saccharopine dehydrogenase NADP-binding domain-containing protein [Bacteroidetes bacterium]|nr:saccharopine dehydrogenase NADP-binding domain-containing protein [Bacteroidota bacterium]MBS1756765.1 saccharopine dehydrogenase NADP-binding domain-containing protein [Bacteroidota bacterium]